MGDLIWVCPQNYLLSENDWKSRVKKSGYIPILRTDLSKFKQSLQQSLKNRPAVLNNVTVSENKAVTGSKSGETDEMKDQAISTYKPIEQFLQSNPSLTTFGIRLVVYMESTSKVEALLTEWIDYLKSQVKVTQEKNPLRFDSWSRIYATGFETQDIFVRVSAMDNDYTPLYQFLNLFQRLGDTSDKFSINFDENLTQRITDELPNKTIDQSTIDDHSQHMENILEKYISRGNNTSSGNEFDTKKLTTEEYHIDLNTLSDLPRESLDQLCKDIREFRNRVITIEREKIMKDSIEENQRRRQKMVQMFDDIHKKQATRNTSVNDILESSSNAKAYPDDSQFNEDDDGSAAEKESTEKKNIEAKNRYKKLLHKLNTTIEPGLKTLELRLTEAENYDTWLEKIRPVTIKELLHLGEDMYYDSKRSYRKTEELLDNKNREKCGSHVEMPPLVIKLSDELAKETHTPVETNKQEVNKDSRPSQPNTASDVADINITLNFSKAVKSKEDGQGVEPAISSISGERLTKPDEEGTKNHLPNILPFNDQELVNKLKRLKESKLVDELIKEYLGVYEEELVDYIFDNIKEFKNKDNLLEELKETFDEDAVIIVDRIWNSEDLSS